MATKQKKSPAPYAPFVFDQLLVEALRKGKTKFTTVESMNWFRTKVARSNISKNKLMSEGIEAHRNKSKGISGRLYFYAYDPKTKAEMPFYDAFPLVFIIDMDKTGFYGLNVHYLPPMLRVDIMRQLYKFSTDKTFTDKTKLQLSYATLKFASGKKLYKPCFKRYLFGHLRSPFIEIMPAEWTPAVFLPVADWRKASQQTVWNWSRSKL